MSIELLQTKIDRWDGSLTEAEKIEFRKSAAWRELRNIKYQEQDGKDPITGEPLKPDFNCHHLCLKSYEYTNISDPARFVALNKDTHEEVHELYTFDWKTRVPKDSPYYTLLEKMDIYNDDIEKVLFENHYDYTVINPGDKYGNMMLGQQYHYPMNSRGLLQWHKRYIPAEYPQDTKAWFIYMCLINKDKSNNFVKLILELRHANLYSSYKNFRNNPYASENTKKDCRKELETTTRYLRFINK